MTEQEKKLKKKESNAKYRSKLALKKAQEDKGGAEKARDSPGKPGLAPADEGTQPATIAPDDGLDDQTDWDCFGDVCKKCRMDPDDPATSRKLHSPTCHLAALDAGPPGEKATVPGAKGY